MDNQIPKTTMPPVPPIEKVCPVCKTVNRRDAKRCYSCDFDFESHEEMLKKLKEEKQSPNHEKSSTHKKMSDEEIQYLQRKSKTKMWTYIGITFVVIFLGLGIFSSITSTNDDSKTDEFYVSIYDFWCENIRSQWVVHEIADIEDIEFEEDEDGYNAIVPFTADNNVEETTEAKAYCSAYINDENEMVEKLSGCFLAHEDEEEDEEDSKENQNTEKSDKSDTNNESPNDSYTGVIPDLSLYTANYNMVVRESPDYSANEVGKIKKGEIIQVLDINGSINESVWGQIGDNQWVCLEDSENIYFQKNN